jgi:hypothetical protein
MPRYHLTSFVDCTNSSGFPSGDVMSKILNIPSCPPVANRLESKLQSNVFTTCCSRVIPVVFRKAIKDKDGNFKGNIEIFEDEEVIDAVVRFIRKSKLSLDEITLKNYMIQQACGICCSDLSTENQFSGWLTYQRSYHVGEAVQARSRDGVPYLDREVPRRRPREASRRIEPTRPNGALVTGECPDPVPGRRVAEHGILVVTRRDEERPLSRLIAAIVIVVAGRFFDGAELELGEGTGVSRTDYGYLPPGGGGGRFGGGGYGCHGLNIVN